MSKSLKARDWMTASLITFTPETGLLDAAHTLVEHRIAGAPVLDDRGNLVGMLAEEDCLKAVLHAAYHGEPVAGRVGEYMTPAPLDTVQANESIIHVAEKFLAQHHHRFPVFDGNRLVGQISRSDILRAMGQLR